MLIWDEDANLLREKQEKKTPTARRTKTLQHISEKSGAVKREQRSS